MTGLPIPTKCRIPATALKYIIAIPANTCIIHYIKSTNKEKK